MGFLPNIGRPNNSLPAHLCLPALLLLKGAQVQAGRRPGVRTREYASGKNEEIQMLVSRGRKRARSLFAGGLLFFMVGIVLDQVAVIGLAILMLLGALIWHIRNPESSDRGDAA
jgi:hypothetical protein